MKRLIASILTACLLLTLVACGGNKGPGPEDDTPVELVFPASLFESDDDFDPDEYVQENGFLSAAFTDDGSLKVTMTKARHQEMIEKTKRELEEDLAEMIGDEDTPYIKAIDHNDDFSVVTVKVDREAYENAFDLTPFAIGMTVYFYHMILDQEYHCQIDMVDIATGDVIDTATYPDAFND